MSDVAALDDILNVTPSEPRHDEAMCVILSAILQDNREEELWDLLGALVIKGDREKAACLANEMLRISDAPSELVLKTIDYSIRMGFGDRLHLGHLAPLARFDENNVLGLAASAHLAFNLACAELYLGVVQNRPAKDIDHLVDMIEIVSRLIRPRNSCLTHAILRLSKRKTLSRSYRRLVKAMDDALDECEDRVKRNTSQSLERLRKAWQVSNP